VSANLPITARQYGGPSVKKLPWRQY